MTTRTVKHSGRLVWMVALIVLTSFEVLASGGTVTGRVMIENDGPAVGATVVLGETRLGSSVGEDGTFTIRYVPPGRYTVRVRLVGYAPEKESVVEVERNSIVEVSLTLTPVDIQLNQVVVTGSRARSAEDVRTSVNTMLPRESKMLPGAAEDILRSLQALPGVTSVSDFSSQLVVRGSGPDQNLMLIDGFEVLNPYRLYGFISMYNPEAVSDISLQTGGFGAQYGDRLSAVLDVRTREGRPDATVSGKVNVSLTNLNAIVEGAVPAARISYLFSVRRTYYDLILGPILKSARLVEGDVALPNFGDLQGKLAVSLDARNKLLFNAFSSRDGVDLISGVERDRPDSVNVFDESHNTLLGATWQFTPSKEVVSQTQFSWYRNDGRGTFDGRFVDPAQNTGDLGRGDTLGLRFVNFGVDYGYRYTKRSLTQRVILNLNGQVLEFGGGVDFLGTDFTRFFQIDDAFKQFLESLGQAIPSDATESLSYHRFNGFVQDRIPIGGRLFIEPGVRIDAYPFLGRKVYLAPRFGVSIKLDEISTLRGAYGVYYQSPGMEKQDFRNRFVYTASSFQSLVAERADHVVIGYDRLFGPQWQFKFESYYKSFSNSLAQEKLPGSEWSTRPTGGDPYARDGWTTPVLVAADSLTSRPVNDAVGSSYGIEFLFQKIRTLPADRFTGWVSYALSFAERDRDGLRTPFVFDQRHAANIVGNYRFAERWDVGLRFTLRSGRPFQEALGVQPRVLVVESQGAQTPVIQTDASGKVILDVAYERETYSGRLNLYHALDLRITTYPQWWGLDWALYLDIQNVYNRKNEQQMRYYVGEGATLVRRPVYGLPIFPSLGLSLAF